MGDFLEEVSAEVAERREARRGSLEKENSLRNSLGKVLEAEEAGSRKRRGQLPFLGHTAEIRNATMKQTQRKVCPRQSGLFMWSLMKGTGYLACAMGALGAHFGMSLPAFSHLTKDSRKNPRTSVLPFPHQCPQAHSLLSSPSGSHSLSSSIFLPFSPFSPPLPSRWGPRTPNLPDVLKDFYA